MKFLKIFFSFSLMLTLSTCEKHSVNDCSKPFASTTKNNTTVNVVSDLKYNLYEVEYGSKGFELGNGTKSNSTSIGGLSQGTYDFYIRGNCGGNKWSEWSDVTTVSVSNGGGSSSCRKPYDVDNYSYGCEMTIDWKDENYPDDADHFELEYGPTGFSLGTGTVATMNNSSYDGGTFAKGTTYDVYIKSNCGGTDWSEYSDVFSFYADENYKMCLNPMNLSAIRSGSSITIGFEPNGECNYQYVIVEATANVNSEQFTNVTTSSNYTTTDYGFSSWVSYKLFVRSDCGDGAYSNWEGFSIP